MRKFEGIDDIILIELFHKGNRDAEIELVERYTYRSVSMAEIIVKAMDNSGIVTINELVNIGLLTMYDSIKTYKHTNSFYAYWKRIAFNNMLDEVKRIAKLYEVTYFGPNMDSVETSFASETKDMLRHEIEEAFDNPQNKFKPDDKTIFYMILDGYSIREIAELYEVTYQAINYRLKRITNRLSNILFIKSK